MAEKLELGAFVEKVSGSSWRGKVVGFYSTDLTPEGYAVESSTEKGSVQIYPRKALRLATPDRSDDALAEEKHRLRHMLIRSTLCLSGFVGEGISVEGHEDPDDVYLAAVELLGMEAADDDDLRAALKGDGL